MQHGGVASARGIEPGAVALALMVAVLLICPARADTAVDSLQMTADHADTWSESGVNILQLQGPVTIELDQTRLTADRAVVWLTSQPGRDDRPQRVDIALIGNARAEQPELTRSGPWLMVDAMIRGPVRLTARERTAADHSDSGLYQQALDLKQSPQPPAALVPGEADTIQVHEAPKLSEPSPRPAPTRATTAPSGPSLDRPAPPAVARIAPVNLQGEFGHLETVSTEDGKLAIVLSNHFLLSQERDNGDLLQLQAERGVIFTTLDSITDADALSQIRNVSQAITGAYLEGDVIITSTPAGIRSADQRLEARRVFYDFLTDRAVLTQAVFHTVDVGTQTPIILRARVLRQLSRGERMTEFSADNTELTTSGFKTPSLAVRTQKVFVRQTDTGNPRYGTRTTFAAEHATVRMFNIPFLYLPVIGGSMTERGFPLRQLQIGNSKHFGTSVQTRWGLFETLGQVPPEDLDVSYNLSYFSDRGPAGGLDLDYGGGFITDTTRQPWNFTGELNSFFVYDDGVDNLGRHRRKIPHSNEFRGRINWEHQHFFPDDWQVQLRANWLSDPTFLEEWFERDFDTGLPQETSAYFKRQKETEAITLLATVQPNEFVTTSDLAQEQFEIERIPEIGYHRIGDSFAQDRFTFFSDNQAGALKFDVSDAELGEQGYRFYTNSDGERVPVFPGRPSLGRAGVPGAPVPVAGLTEPTGLPDVTEETVYRGDFRQEADFPFAIGRVKVLPYVMGRYTAYSDSPDDSAQDRVYAGTGVRFNTQVWKVYEKPESRLLDIHRVRHIIEPELHLYTSAQTDDQTDLFIYDEPIDGIHDVSAAQIALRQRWQTKRGGPGRQRSVDFFTFNLEGNFFANEPVDAVLEPTRFRGLFFPSLPETSIPRDSLNADASWRISDTTIILADAQQNLRDMELATASLGFAASRDTRLSYFVGMRYIEELDSAIGSFAADYQLSTKYTMTLNQSYDFGDNSGVYSTLGLRRKFDRFFLALSIYHDDRDDESGFRINFYPEGLGYAFGSDLLDPRR